VVTTFSGADVPTLEDVDILARVMLAARRGGGQVHLEEVCTAFGELLELAGLSRQMGGESEGGKELLGIQEGMDPRDTVA
jgi:hypothetical protein